VAVSIDTYFDILQSWLQEIAKNTAQTRDAVQGIAKNTTPSAQQSAQQTQFERLASRLEKAVSSGVGQALGQARSLASRGFAGTVESARLDYAVEQLGRQFAAVMSPILNGFTYAAVEIERRFRGLNGAQQNGIMGGLIGAGIGARFGGLPGAALGFVAGSAFAGGGSTTGAMAGAGAGALLGFRAGGPIGALFGAVGGAAASAPVSYESERPSDYYSRLRTGGASRLGAAFSTGGEALSRLFSSGRPGAPPGPGAAPPPRRDVTPFSADPLAAGGTADLIQKAMIRATAGADFAEDNPMKPLVDIGIRLIEILIAIATGTGITVPASAVETRS